MSKVTAKQYSRELRRRCLEGMVAKAESGGYPSKPPLGYVIRRDTGPDGEAKQRGGTIVKQPWCDPLLRRMHALRISGQSFRLIADQVIEEGLVPENKRRGFTRPSRASWVENLLKNPFYAGFFFWRGIRYPASHQPVFSAAEWAELQAVSDGKPAPLRTAKREAALAGFLKCAECGCQITYDPKSRDGRVHHYYRCANGKKQHSKLTYVVRGHHHAWLRQRGGVDRDRCRHRRRAEPAPKRVARSDARGAAPREREVSARGHRRP
jgi:hypothetical protein